MPRPYNRNRGRPSSAKWHGKWAKHCLIAFTVMMAGEAGHTQEIPSPVTAYLEADEGVPQREDRQVMARCIAHRHPHEVQSVTRSQDASSDKKHVLIELSCMKARYFRRSAVAINGIYYSYLSESLLLSDYAASTLPDISHVAPLDHPAPPDVDLAKFPPQYRDRFIVDKWWQKVNVMAECVAREVPAKVFALAGTATDSQPEKVMVDGLRDTLATCKVSALSPSPPAFAVRAALSENLYRLVDAARPIVHDK